MKITFPFAELATEKLITVGPGTLFYKVFDTTHDLGELCMAIEGGSQTYYVTLTGPKPFHIIEAKTFDAQQKVLPIPTDKLCIRLDNESSPDDDLYSLGSLHVNADGAFISVAMAGQGNSSTVYDLSLTGLILAAQPVGAFACFQSWKLVSRAENGKEKVLLTVDPSNDDNVTSLS